MKDFSIIIPTYNRKKSLVKAIRAILVQPQSKDVHIVLLDNGSNYNVDEALKQNFSESELANIELISYPVNIGASLNICMPFFYCKTKWLWILSDDDEANPDSLQIIFDDIEKYPDTGIFKYSFTGYINTQYEDEVYSSLEEVVGMTGKPKQTAFMLCSNGVYNLDVLQPYRGDIIRYAYNNIGAYNPICIMLDEHAGTLMTRSKSILDYKRPEAGTGWSSFRLYMEVGSFLDYPFKCSGKVLMELWGGGPIPFWDFMHELKVRNLHKDKVKCQLAFDKVFVTYYKKNWLKKLAFSSVFYIYKYSGMNLMEGLWRKKKIK